MTFNEALSAALVDDNAPEYVKGLLSEIDRQAVALGNLHRRNLPSDPTAVMLANQRDLAIANGQGELANFYRLERIKYLNNVFV